MESCTLCEPWSAYKALRLGLLERVVPVLGQRTDDSSRIRW